jgi:hypothetical protein
VVIANVLQRLLPAGAVSNSLACQRRGRPTRNDIELGALFGFHKPVRESLFPSEFGSICSGTDNE